MKKVLLICFMCAISLGGMAQTKNVDIDNLSFYYSYRSQPSEHRDPIFFKYSGVATGTPVVKKNIEIEDVANAISIEGQTKVESPEEADMQVELFLGDIIIIGSNVSERKSENKKDGKVISVNYYYSAVITYTFESVLVIKWKGKEFKKYSIADRSSMKQLVSSEYGSRKEAADFWNNNKEVHIASFYREQSFDAASTASRVLSGNYGFRPAKDRDHLRITDEKKHNENTPFRDATNALKDALQEMTPNVPLNREKIESIITYFKSIPEKYTGISKADIRLRYAAYYNLCRIYLHLDEPQNVAEYADLLISNEYDKKDGEKLKKEANELMKLFNNTNIKTRHFDPASFVQ